MSRDRMPRGQDDMHEAIRTLWRGPLVSVSYYRRRQTLAIAAGMGAWGSIAMANVMWSQGSAATRQVVTNMTLRSTSPTMLIVRPRVGDTLHLQMEQTIETVGRTTNAAISSSSSANRPGTGGDQVAAPPAPRAAEYGPRRGQSWRRLTRLQLFAHSVVELSSLTSTTLLATTDSIDMWAGTTADADSATAPPKRLTLPLDGRQVRVQVTHDGAMRINDPPPGAMELGSTLAAIPGMLPDAPVRVGDSWECDIPLPSLPVSGFRTDGVVRARFRFDSLTRHGRDAWISLEGTLRRDGAVRDLPAGTRVITAGTMVGVLVVDRDRGWIVDARTMIDVRSDVSSGPSMVTAPSPLQVDLRIKQRMRVK